MVCNGIVQNGVVVLPQGVSLPDGTVVEVSLVEATTGNNTDESLGFKLAALGKWAETVPTEMPADLAQHHDHYLHGAPRQ